MTGFETPLLIGATAITAVGSIAQGNAAKKASDYNAAVGMANARAARRDATENARRQRRLNRKAAGTLRNKNFVSMDVLEDQSREMELAALDILHGGEVNALGFERSATLDKMRGKAAQTAGYFSAAGTLLKGGRKASAFDGFGKTTFSPGGMGDTPGTFYGTG